MPYGALKKCNTSAGCEIRFFNADSGLVKRLLRLPIKSLNDGVPSGNSNGCLTSLRKACLEKPSCISCPKNVTLFNDEIDRSTEIESPICTMEQPSLLFKNLIRTTLPYWHSKLNKRSQFMI